ncbi:hypothetical protein F2Q69_00022823 [Brassica cretica]|uniref:Uncharacterized protein n=1 Tax=Brassica cretica TaxID=69181 RepID=A0A8S9QQH9_BRACR|nr:hypothetical protein F2Q69_00022823 [Brassica cretica]
MHDIDMTDWPGQTAFAIWRAGQDETDGQGRTMLAIWRAGRDGPCSPYGKRVGMNRARHMASELGQTTLAIWREGRDGRRSPYGEWAGMNRARRAGRAGLILGFHRMMMDCRDAGTPLFSFCHLFPQDCLSKRLDFSIRELVV